MEEIWKDIEGYEGLYQVSNLGRVKSVGRNVRKWNHFSYQPEKFLKQCEDTYGYCVVGLYKEKKLRVFKVHRLVANEFVDNPKNKETVNHINGNKHDNAASNLEWLTDAENKQHAFATGLTGGKHFYNNKRSKPVLKYDMEMQLVKKYPSIREAERDTGIQSSLISSCFKGKCKRAGQNIWEYEQKATE